MIPSLLIDTHVHFYPCFDIDTFFNSAYDHFQTAIRHHALQEDSLGCLVLTETPRENAFHLFKSLTKDQWGFYPTEEEETLLVRDAERTILVIAGRQIVTKESIEVLALETTADFKEGISLDETIQAIVQKDALPVIPWGFGKWRGRRGKIIESILSSGEISQLLLGDNGGRPKMGIDPFLFQIAASKGTPIIPGSDPLPFKTQERNAGRCGVIMDGYIDTKKPGETIKKMLCQLSVRPTTYGKGERLISFIINQMRMQLIKRMRNYRT